MMDIYLLKRKLSFETGCYFFLKGNAIQMRKRADYCGDAQSLVAYPVCLTWSYSAPLMLGCAYDMYRVECSLGKSQV